MDTSTKISATLEDYLEAILTLDRDKGAARSRDIAAALSVHRSTVTAALHTLSEKGLINYSPYELTTLTRRGRRIAQQVSEKHETIHTFLTEVLLLDDDVAEANACRMEHHIDSQVLDRLLLFARFAHDHPHADRTWTRDFTSFIKRHGKRKGKKS